MPNFLKNWNFKMVERILKQHNFTLINVRGSHHYFSGNINLIPRIVTVPFNGSKSINPKTMKSIVVQSGIQIKEWI